MSGEQDEDREISDSVSDSLKLSFSLLMDLRFAPHCGERMKSMPKASFVRVMSMVCVRGYQVECQSSTAELTRHLHLHRSAGSAGQHELTAPFLDKTDLEEMEDVLSTRSSQQLN